MRVEEAAQRLEVSVSLVYKLVKAGKLRCVRHTLKRDGRGAIRISEAHITEYLAACEDGPAYTDMPLQFIK